MLSASQVESRQSQLALKSVHVNDYKNKPKSIAFFCENFLQI